MDILYKCFACQSQYRTHLFLNGRKFLCPKCGDSMSPIKENQEFYLQEEELPQKTSVLSGNQK